MQGTTAMSKRNYLLAPLAGLGIFIVVALLYGPYVGSPSIFDDVYFFLEPQKYVDSLSWSGLFDRRWVSNATLALTYRLWGAEHGAYHIGNLLIHGLTAFSLFLLIRDLLAHERDGSANLPAFTAAMLFALHPVAAFAVGYIVERSIVLAGLFSIWMWIAVHRGVADGRKSWLLLSAAFYFLAVFSKEHAVAALPVALLVAWNAANGEMRKTLSSLALPLPLWMVTAAAIVLRLQGIIGAAYEPLLGEMGAEFPHTVDYLLRSVLNQSGLFFKYMLFWLVPNETWMAIDLRVPFPPTWFAWPWVLGMLAFAAYGGLTAIALWRGWLPRLAGIGLIAPWLLFLTMFSAVQYQEAFVLYRSYYWALPGALLVAFLLSKIPQRAQVTALLVVGLVCFGASWSRLQTFSHPVLLWDEAVSRLDGRDDLPGAYRIYHNRGIAYANMGGLYLAHALLDYNKVVQLNPSYPYVYNDRGAAYFELGDYAQALSDFNYALDLKPAYLRPHLGRGLTLLKLGRYEEGMADLAHACTFGIGCNRYHDELAKIAKPV